MHLCAQVSFVKWSLARAFVPLNVSFKNSEANIRWICVFERREKKKRLAWKVKSGQKQIFSLECVDFRYVFSFTTSFLTFSIAVRRQCLHWLKWSQWKDAAAWTWICVFVFVCMLMMRMLSVVFGKRPNAHKYTSCIAWFMFSGQIRVWFINFLLQAPFSIPFQTFHFSIVNVVVFFLPATVFSFYLRYDLWIMDVF